MRRREPYLIADLAQIRALASPVRQEVVDAVEAAGPLTVPEIARLLGRAADSLYYHVRRLEKVRLLVRDAGGRAKERTGVVYDVPGVPLRLSYDLTGPSRTRAVRSVVDGVLRLARRDFGRALLDPGAVVMGPARDTWGGRVRGWATPADLERINRRIGAALAALRTKGRRKNSRPVALVFVLTPLRVKSQKRSRKAGSE